MVWPLSLLTPQLKGIQTRLFSQLWSYSEFTNTNNRQRRSRGAGCQWRRGSNFQSDLALSPCVASDADLRCAPPSGVPFNLVRPNILLHGNMDGPGRSWLAYL